jgi:hypothetical protein
MLFAQDYTAEVAVMGPGGVGKMQLVLELLFRTKEKCPALKLDITQLNS